MANPVFRFLLLFIAIVLMCAAIYTYLFMSHSIITLAYKSGNKGYSFSIPVSRNENVPTDTNISNTLSGKDVSIDTQNVNVDTQTVVNKLSPEHHIKSILPQEQFPGRSSLKLSQKQKAQLEKIR